MHTNKKYQCLASAFKSYSYYISKNNNDTAEMFMNDIKQLIESLPHGSGIDSTTNFSYLSSKEDKLIITSGYHHMDNNGYYDGWTDFKIILTPSWYGFNLKIQGAFPRKYADTREYLEDLFATDLDQGYTHPRFKEAAKALFSQ
jgi:hypothetical protein